LCAVNISACYHFDKQKQVRPTSGFFGDSLPRHFGEAIPIRAIVADQQAALFGECCFEVGDCKVTIGTGCFIDINTGSQPLVSAHGYAFSSSFLLLLLLLVLL